MIRIYAAIVLLTLLSVGCATSSYTTVTKDDVISLTKKGVSDGVIINKIRSSRSRFDLSSDDLVALKDAGVSDTVVNAMLRNSGERYSRGYYYSPGSWDPYWYGSYSWYRPFYYSYPNYYGPYIAYPHYSYTHRPPRVRR